MITVQEEVEETKVIFHTFVKLLIMMILLLMLILLFMLILLLMMILLFMLILLFVVIIMTMDIVRTMDHRSRKSSARQSSVRLAPSNSRKIAEMSPGRSLHLVLTSSTHSPPSADVDLSLVQAGV